MNGRLSLVLYCKPVVMAVVGILAVLNSYIVCYGIELTSIRSNPMESIDRYLLIV